MQKMTLHEAIEKLLTDFGRPMTTKEIADELNKNKWYQKRNNSPIDPFQIHGRTKNYPQLFDKDGSTVILIKQDRPASKTTRKTFTKLRPTKSLTPNYTNIDKLEKELMDEKLFKSASLVDSLVPDLPGLYCIRITNAKCLPFPFDTELSDRKHNIIYIGIASQNLNRRLLHQELRAKGHGTFFRSIGAVLGFRPIKGSQTNKKNKKNYKFSDRDELKIIEWINDNLKVNWVAHPDNFDMIELTFIQKYRPLLNLAKNPAAFRTLSNLRAECIRVANEN